MSLIVKKVKRKRILKQKAILVYSTRIVSNDTNSGSNLNNTPKNNYQ